MRTTMAGPKGVVLAGNDTDLPAALANDLLARGYAVLPKESRPEPEEKAVPKPQTADAPPPGETGEAPRARPKRRKGRKPAPPPPTE